MLFYFINSTENHEQAERKLQAQNTESPPPPAQRQKVAHDNALPEETNMLTNLVKTQFNLTRLIAEAMDIHKNNKIGGPSALVRHDEEVCAAMQAAENQVASILAQMESTTHIDSMQCL